MGKKYANTLKNLARGNVAISEAPPEDLLVRSDPHLSVPFSVSKVLSLGGHLPGTRKRPPSSRTETPAPHVSALRLLAW